MSCVSRVTRQRHGQVVVAGMFIVAATACILTNMNSPARRVTRSYNQRRTAEQWIKERKNAVRWKRLSCRRFDANQVRLPLHVLAYNLAHFLRRLTLLASVRHWSLTTLREKLVKIGAQVIHRARYAIFQLARWSCRDTCTGRSCTESHGFGRWRCCRQRVDRCG